ncbi:ankyrin repeat domain-containing protein [bacterium]|nr:MAG: ankyrin repeat domain-containing protein [bacterium]
MRRSWVIISSCCISTLMIFFAGCANAAVEARAAEAMAAGRARPIDKALMDAVTASEDIKVTALLKRGADPNAKDGHMETPLHSAAWNGNTRIAALLIENGADVNVKNSSGDTPLHLAAYYGKTGVMLILIEKGAGVDAKSDLDETALHRAAMQGKSEAAKILVENGADVNARSKLKFLEKLKAKVKGKGKEGGHTPLYYAEQKKSETIVQFLKEHGAKR